MCIRYCRDWGDPDYAKSLREYLDATGDIDSVVAALVRADEDGDEHLQYFFLDQMQSLSPEAERRIKALGYEEYMNSNAR